MDYIKDFDFYLLPSSDAFNEFLSNYKSKEEIPRYSKKDFAPIVDTAIKYNLHINSNLYHSKDILIERLLEETKSNDFSEKVENIYFSHMGIPILNALCIHSTTPWNKKGDIEKEIITLLNLNNMPVEFHPDEIKVKKLSRK